jgi:oligopeptide transport system substrate-binding protein
MPTVDILFNRDAGHDVIAQAVASDWERNLGVSVSLRQREIKVFRNDLKQKNYMVSRAAWFGDYGDPLTFLDLNRTGDGNNDRGFSYKPYDDLLEAADAELDADKRYDILSQAEKMVIEEQAPMIPIFHYNQVYLFDPHVLSGISPHPRQKQYLFLVDKLDPAAEPTKALEMPARPPGAVK